MIVGTLKIHLNLRQARSLKDKRRAVKSIKDRLSNEFNCAVAELECQDIVQQIVLGVAVIGSDQRVLESVLDRLAGFVERNPHAELAYTEREFFY